MGIFLLIMSGLVMVIGIVGYAVCDEKKKSFSVYIENPEKAALERKQKFFIFLLVVSLFGMGLVMNNFRSL